MLQKNAKSMKSFFFKRSFCANLPTQHNPARGRKRNKAAVGFAVFAGRNTTPPGDGNNYVYGVAFANTVDATQPRQGTETLCCHRRKSLRPKRRNTTPPGDGNPLACSALYPTDLTQHNPARGRKLVDIPVSHGNRKTQHNPARGRKRSCSLSKQ